MNGFLLIDKPAGLTSADVVRRVKRRVDAKVGHLGTLDPFATGVLPLCLGEATKIAQFLNAADKRYEGMIQLGWATDSGDCTGARTRTTDVPQFDTATLASVAARFIGAYEQTPPMYSALKREGVPLYRAGAARGRGRTAARVVHIGELQLHVDGTDRLRFVVTARRVPTCACWPRTSARPWRPLPTWRRYAARRSGRFEIDASVALDAWDPDRETGLLSIRDALAEIPAMALTGPAAAAARQGKAWVLAEIALALGDEDRAMLLDPAGETAAVVVREGQRWTYGRVLAAATSLYITYALC